MKFKTEEITNYMYNKIQWLFQPKIWLVIFPVQYKLLHLHFVLVRPFCSWNLFNVQFLCNNVVCVMSYLNNKITKMNFFNLQFLFHL